VNRDSRIVSGGSTLEDLEAYPRARAFRKAMYRVVQQLPEGKKFGLAGQVRRAAVSLTNNIEEGHGRFHFLDKIKFTLQSRGSLKESIDDLNDWEDDGYVRYRRAQKSSNESTVKEESSGYGEEAEIETIHESRFSESR